MTPLPGQEAHLASHERKLLWLILLAAILFGGIVELRSAFLRRRMTDLDVYLRAAWSVRAGGSIYEVTDDNGWHYHYPPLLAILLTPLADPPAGVDREGCVPFAVSVAVWYWANLLLLAWSCLRLSLLLAPHASPVKAVWPFLVCIAPIGSTLARGQVNILLLGLLIGMLVEWLSERPFRSGMWLAAAICLKVIPAYLLVFFIWKRSLRGLTGCIVGLCLGLMLIPSAALGPARTLDLYAQWGRVLALPGLGAGSDRSRANELISITFTDSQSFVAVLHNTMHPIRQYRPISPEPWLRGIHWACVAALTFGVLHRSLSDGQTLAALFILMALASPVCHLHYAVLALPAVMVLQHHARPDSESRRNGAIILALVLVFPHLPGLHYARDLGLCMYALLSLVVVVCKPEFLSRRLGRWQAPAQLVGPI